MIVLLFWTLILLFIPCKWLTFSLKIPKLQCFLQELLFCYVFLTYDKTLTKFWISILYFKDLKKIIQKSTNMLMLGKVIYYIPVCFEIREFGLVDQTLLSWVLLTLRRYWLMIGWSLKSLPAMKVAVALVDMRSAVPFSTAFMHSRSPDARTQPQATSLTW